jgi:hypothetical protein
LLLLANSCAGPASVPCDPAECRKICAAFNTEPAAPVANPTPPDASTSDTGGVRPADPGSAVIQPADQGTTGAGQPEPAQGGDGSCEQPFVVALHGGIYQGNMNGSGTLTSSCGESAGVERIFRWLPARSGHATLSLKTDYWPASLYVRDGSCQGAELACNHQESSWPSFSLELDVRAQHAYFIVVDGFYDGPITLTYTMTIAPAS